jgi:hemerythrin-like metal-binding protein
VLRIESLLVALKSKRSMSALRECLHFLEQYTSEHFHTEEHFMSEHGYPGIEDHVEVHEHFKENVSKAGAFIQANPNSDQSLQLVQSMLVNWYVQHIKGIDRKYIKYFKENGII